MASSRTQDVRFVLFGTHQLDVPAMFIITSEQKDTLYQINYSNFEKLKILENSQYEPSLYLHYVFITHRWPTHITSFSQFEIKES